METGKFNNAWKELVWIMKMETFQKGRRIKKPTKVCYCVPCVPDLLIKYGQNPDSWVYLDYVNTEGENERNFVRVYRGLIALEAVMKIRNTGYKKFYVAVRDSLYQKSRSRASFPWGDFVKFKIERLPLTYIIKLLEEKRLQNDYYDVQCMQAQ